MPRSTRLSPGEQLGAYEIVGSVGTGGMGEVYRARDPRLERDVALKVLPAEVANQPDRLIRFEREAKSLAALNHPNIVTVYSVEESDGVPFLTMELVEGKPLSRLIPAGGMALERFLEIAIPLSDAMATAHSRGVIHRDLKPANVMITREGRVKVVDFGLARRAVSGGPKTLASLPTQSLHELTREGQLLGTVPYMAPEQLRGQPGTPRSDIFSMGAVLYQMATGRRPFTGDTDAELVSAIMRDEPVSVSEVRSELPRQLDRILARCLAKTPDRRYQSALDVRNEFEALRAEKQENTLPITVPLPTDIKKVISFRRWLPVLAITVLGVAFSWWMTRQKEPSPTPTVGPMVASLVALPATVHGGEEDLFLSDAIPGSLSTYLAEVRGLTVKAPPSAAEMERIDDSLERVAQIFGVDAVLNSTVTTQASLFTVNLQLVKPGSRELIWSRHYEGTPTQYLEMVRHAADDLRRQLGHEEVISVTGLTASSGAELAFRQGQHFSNRYNMTRRAEDFEAAERNFLEALNLDSGMAEAAAELAFLNHIRVESGEWSAVQEIDKWSRRALELNPSSSLGWVGRASAALLQGESHTEVLRHTLQAVNNGPGNARAHSWLGVANAGASVQFACAAYNRSVELDPFYLPPRAGVASCLLGQERYEEALAALDVSLRIEPEDFLAHLLALPALLQLGRIREARESMSLLEKMGEDGRIPSDLVTLVSLSVGLDQGEVKGAELVEAARRAQETSLWTPVVVAHYIFPKLAAKNWSEEFWSLAELGGPMPYDALQSLSTVFGDGPQFQAALNRSRSNLEENLAILEDAQREGRLPAYLVAMVEKARRSLDREGS